MICRANLTQSSLSPGNYIQFVKFIYVIRPEQHLTAFVTLNLKPRLHVPTSFIPRIL